MIMWETVVKKSNWSQLFSSATLFNAGARVKAFDVCREGF